MKVVHQQGVQSQNLYQGKRRKFQKSVQSKNKITGKSHSAQDVKTFSKLCLLGNIKRNSIILSKVKIPTQAPVEAFFLFFAVFCFSLSVPSYLSHFSFKFTITLITQLEKSVNFGINIRMIIRQSFCLIGAQGSMGHA